MEVWKALAELSGYVVGLILLVVLIGIVGGIIAAPFVLGWEKVQDWWWDWRHRDEEVKTAKRPS